MRRFREAILVFTAALGVHHDHPLLLRRRGHRSLTVRDVFLDPVPRERPLRDEDYAEFRQAVVIALASGPTYRPGHVGPCKLRQEVVQPFVFRLQRPPTVMPDSPLRD